MHIRPCQMNAYLTLDALRSSEQVAAKRRAEATRKKLFESASEVAGEAEFNEAYVFETEAREESQERPKARSQNEPHRKGLEAVVGSEEDDEHISDWA